MSAVQLRDPIGVGIACPFRFSSRGGVQLTASTHVELNQTSFASGNRRIRVLRANDDEQKVVLLGAVRRIILTHVGTRLMNGTFGSRVAEVPFEPNNILFRNAAMSFATLAVQLNEPRIVLVGGTAQEAGDGTQVDVVLQYRSAGMALTNSLVVPIKPGGNYVHGL